MSANARDKARDENLVVIVTHRFWARQAKIGASLAHAGLRVIVLCYEDIPQPVPWAEQIIHYKTDEECLTLATKFNPIVYHVFSHWSFDLVEKFTRYKPGPIVMDNYDVLSGIIHNDHPVYSRDQKIELKASLAADGHACRSLENKRLQEAYGKLPGLCGFFPDSCWNDPKIEEQQSFLGECQNDEFHIVFQGNVCTDFENSNLTTNFHPWLAQHFKAQKIHYHLFPANNHKDTESAKLYRYLVEENKDNPYFHLHYTLDMNALTVKLSQYDAGLLIMSKDVDGKDDGVYTTKKYKYCIGNKIFDFFDAGIPTLIFPAWFSNRIAVRHGGARVIQRDDLLNIRTFLEGLNWRELKQKAIISRKKYDHRKIGPRLYAFYKKVQHRAYASFS
ncbi:hypothetical protein E1160_00530 [Rhodospirillaceae bacterium RKSG073]|nr:hypothetical protein [Curvivirga aplysinae]